MESTGLGARSGRKADGRGAKRGARVRSVRSIIRDRSERRAESGNPARPVRSLTFRAAEKPDIARIGPRYRETRGGESAADRSGLAAQTEAGEREREREKERGEESEKTRKKCAITRAYFENGPRRHVNASDEMFV